MRFRKIRWYRLCILVAVALLGGALPLHAPPAHAIPSTATSCVSTACAVSPIVSDALPSGLGNVASVAKVDQALAYYDGQTTVYGGSNPNIWIGLEASLGNTARNSYNPTFNFRTLQISASITDSSGNAFQPNPDSSGRGGIATAVWDTPYPTGDSVDYANLITDLSTYLIGLLGVPTPLGITTFQQTPNGVYIVSSTVIASWTYYADPCVDTQLFPCGPNGTHVGYVGLYDKAIRLKIIPSFFTPDVYTITISTHTERGACSLQVGVAVTNYCATVETQTQTYSFKYVYENDAGQAGDAADSLPNAGGTPGSILHGSYTGFHYGIDTADVYSFYASQGQKVSFVVTPPASADFGLAVYDTSQNLIQANDLGIGATNGVAFTAAVSGTYFAKISLVSGWGAYSFRLSDQFQLFPTPSSVSLGLVGAASSATSTITVKSPTDFAGRVDLTTSVTPAVPFGPTASLSTVTKTVEASPVSVLAVYYPNNVQNPSNAFSDNGAFAVFDPGSDCCIQVGAKYGGYSVSLPPGATITKVEVLIDHYEERYGIYEWQSAFQVYVGGSCMGGCYGTLIPFRASETRDVFDITGGQSSWTANTVSTLSIAYWVQGRAQRSFLDWLAFRITYATSSVTLTPGGSDARTLTVSKSGSTPTGVYTVTVTGNGGISLSVPVTVSVQDFQITASPTSLKIPPNQSRTTTITILPTNGFTGSVTLSANAVAGYTTSFSTNPILGGSGSSILTITHTAPPASDPSFLTISATSGGRVQTVTITVYNPPPDFSISAAPNPTTLIAGSSSEFTVNVSSLFGFTGTVSLTYDSPPGLTCSALSQSTITLTSATTSGTSTLSCSGPAGVYGINVTGTSGSLSHFEIVAITVQDFSISASPPSLILQAGATGILTINVASLYGFTGTVSLTDTVPASLSCGAITPSSVTNSGTATVSCNSMVAGTYTLTVTGTSGSLSHSATVAVNVVDFAVSSNPTILSLAAGSSSTSAIAVSSLNGFSGTVSLAASASSAGPVVSLWPTSLGLSSGGSATSILSVSVGAATPGTYTVTVTATSGSLVHTATVTVTVTGDFSIGSNPTTLTILRGASGASTITLASLNGFGGTVTLAPQARVIIDSTPIDDSYCRTHGLTIDQPLPTQFWVDLPSSVIGVTCGPLHYDQTFGLSTGTHYLEYGVSAWVGHWHVRIQVNGVVVADLDTEAYHHVKVSFNVGGISISPVVSNGPSATWGSSVTLTGGGSATTTLTVSTTSSTPLGAYVFTLTGASGGLSHSVSVTVNVVDFTLSASPTSITVNAGSSRTSTITLTSLNGFTGTITLAATVSPSGPTVSLNPTSVTLGTSAPSTLTVNTGLAAPGTHTVTVTATSGSLSHTVTVTVNVVDFSISASPASLSFRRGSFGTSTITLTSLNGFSSTVTFTATISPVVSKGPTATLSPTSVTLTAGGSATSTLTVSTAKNTPTGTYTVRVTATSGSLSHTISITVTVT